MKTGSNGLQLIKTFEGFRPVMYLDAVGLPTIGYGTLIDTEAEKYLLTATLTEEQATDLLRAELAYIEPQITRMVQAPINQNQFDALASFCYNLGTGALKRSTLLKRVNTNQNDPAIRGEFEKWCYANGKKLPGLLNRRRFEASLYFSPT